MKRTRVIRIVLLCVLLFLVGYVVVSQIGGEGGPSVAQGSTLVIEIGGEYVDAPNPSPLARVLGEERRPFAGLLSTFALARRDDRLANVVFRIRPLQIGWGKADELRAGIAELRAAGRHTVAFLDLTAFSASRELYVASAADEVYLIEGGTAPLVGLAAEYLFLGGLWEKVGIDFEVAKAGRYKSAVETYAGREMSDASREMANSLLDDANERFIAGLAEGRGQTPEQIRAAIDAGPIKGDHLKSLGIIDDVSHLDVVLDKLGGPVVRQKDYAGTTPEQVGFSPVAEFALVYASGPVIEGRSNDSPLGGQSFFAADSLAEAILEAADAPNIRAIVLRIDSPGGSALASEQVYHALARARERGKPIIASLSDVAASGGYYVAAGTDAIVADPGTLTGSIGVFSLRPILGGLFDKLGVGVVGLTRGKHADFLLAAEPLSEGARERLQNAVLETYDLFLRRVADGRGMTIEAVDSVGEGRVWTGAQALDKGLVDELGGLHAAVRRAKREVDLDEDADVYLLPFPQPKGLAQQILDSFRSQAVSVELPLVELPDALRQLAQLVRSLPARSPVLVPPFLVDIR